MPVCFEILSADGKLLKEAPPATPNSFRFVKDYFLGELVGIIGGQCWQPDMGGIVHVINDPEMIVAIQEGEEIEKLIGEETSVVGLYPEQEPVKFPFTTQKGYLANIAIHHTFPKLPQIYN